MVRKPFTIALLCFATAAIGFGQDLKIDYQVNVTQADSSNYFSFSGPIRYMASTKDTLDANTGASKFGSTHTFMPYLYDVKGNNVLPTGLRGLFLFALAPETQRETDNLTVTKTADGTITVQYCHRGTAYRLVTDRNGRFNFPNGSYESRVIGFIQGAEPQVIAKDFSSNMSAERIDWRKVWDDRIAGGKEIKKGVSTRTGNIAVDNVTSDAYFYWEGSLQVTIERNILRVSGGLNAINR